jgi:hypothetical protein
MNASQTAVIYFTPVREKAAFTGRLHYFQVFYTKFLSTNRLDP